MQTYRRKCVREERVYKKYFSFDATISARIYFSFGAFRGRRPFHSTLQLSKFHNKWYWSWDEYILQKSAISFFVRQNSVHIEMHANDRRMSDLCCTSARYECIILMETRFELPMTPCLSCRFRFSTPDFYIISFYRNLLNAVKSLLKSTYTQMANSTLITD